MSDGGHEAARAAEWAATLIQARRTVLPRRLLAPGPDDAQLHQILAAAAAAPDHDQQLPWRFVLIPDAARARLADAFEAALVQRDATATADQRAQAREKAHRAPTLLLAVVRDAAGGDEVPDAERLVSLGCALQNMLLMATALGFGSALTSGKALQSPALRALFALHGSEQAVCFLSIGTAGAARAARPRPAVEAYVSTLTATQDAQ